MRHDTKNGCVADYIVNELFPVEAPNHDKKEKAKRPIARNSHPIDKPEADGVLILPPLTDLGWFIHQLNVWLFIWFMILGRV